MILRRFLRSVYKRVDNQPRPRCPVQLRLEQLEERALLSAAPIPVYGTGVDAAHHRIMDAAPDPHYAIISGPSIGAAVVMPQGGFPYPYWLADDGNSAFITPAAALANASDGYQQPEGDSVYETTFDLKGYDLTTAEIHGLIGADNTVTQVLLNGRDTGYTPTNAGNNFSSLNALDVTSGFVAGLNTLDFVVHNDAGDSFNPTGFRADLSGTAQLAAPTVATLDTGTDGYGDLLAPGTQDPNWQFTFTPPAGAQDPGGQPAPAAGVPFVTVNNGFPFDGHWAADGPSSQWDSPEANENDAAGGSTDPVGTYTYTTTLDLTNYDPSATTLAGYVSADNTLQAVLLNGQPVQGVTDGSATDYAAMRPLVITSGFQPGVNTLQFVVYNAPQGDGSDNAHNPTAFRAELTVAAQAIDTTALSFQPLAFTEGQEASGAIATFSDPDGNIDPSQYTATVDWGDGYGPQDAAVTGDGSGHFQVVGDYAYAEDGDYTAVVTVTGIADGPMATAQGEVAVADAPLTANALTLSAVAGTPFTGPIGSFTDANPAGSLADFTVSTVSWGDGQTSDAAVTTGPMGADFMVQTGAHTYAAAGNYTVQVTVNDADGQSAVLSNTVAVSATAPPPQNNVVHLNAWSDMNRNHDWESLEPALRLTEVKLYDASTGQEVGDLVTDKDGHAVQNVADGDYKVGVTPPTGYSLEMLKLAGLTGTGGDIILTIDPTTERSQSFHLASFADVTLNAALVPVGTATNQILGPSVVPGNSTYVYAVDFDHTVTNVHWTQSITTPTDPPADTVTAGTSYTSENEAGSSVADTLSFGNGAPAQITLSLTDDQGDTLTKTITVVQVQVRATVGGTALDGNPVPEVLGPGAADFGGAAPAAGVGVDSKSGAQDGMSYVAQVVLTGPNGNQGVNQIQFGFVQHGTESLQATYATPAEKLTAEYNGKPLSSYTGLIDLPKGGVAWYNGTADSLNPGPDGVIFNADSPQGTVPLTYSQSPATVLNLNSWPTLDLAKKITYEDDFTLDVAARTTDSANGASSLYYADATAHWQFVGTGTFQVNPAVPAKNSTITYTPDQNPAVTGSKSWSAVTVPTLEDLSGPTFQTMLEHVTFSG